MTDRLRKLLDAAKPGPWWREGDDPYIYGNRAGGRPNGEGIAEAIYFGRRYEASNDNAALIVALRNAALYLLDVVEAARLVRRWPTGSTDDDWQAFEAALDALDRHLQGGDDD